MKGLPRRIARHPWHLALAAAAAGLALAPAEPPLIALVGISAALLLMSAIAGVAAAGALAAAAMSVGTLMGEARLDAIDRPSQALERGEHVSARATLLTAPRPTRFGWSAEVGLRNGGAHLLAVAGSGVPKPRAPPGATLQLSGGIRAPRPADDFDWPAHLRRRGIAHELVVTSVRATGASRGGVLGLLDGVRERAERAIDAALEPPEAALVRGMVLGQDERIDQLVRDDFRDSGLAHLLAVSGQNVMLLAALAWPLFVVLGLGPAGRTAGLLALIAVYVPLAGAGPSVQRAGVMGAAAVVAIAAARPASRSYALLLAAAVTLALSPRAAADPGWQLSFAAVAGLIWIEPVLLPFLRGLPRPLARGIAVTTAATLATAPLLAHHFGSLPLGTLPANVLALPAVPLVMWGGMLLCAAGQVAWAAPVAGVVGAVAEPAVGYLAMARA